MGCVEQKTDKSNECKIIPLEELASAVSEVSVAVMLSHAVQFCPAWLVAGIYCREGRMTQLWDKLSNKVRESNEEKEDRYMNMKRWMGTLDIPSAQQCAVIG